MQCKLYMIMYGFSDWAQGPSGLPVYAIGLATVHCQHLDDDWWSMYENNVVKRFDLICGQIVVNKAL